MKTLDEKLIRYIAYRLYIIGAVVWGVSFLSQTILMTVVNHPDLYRFSRPLALTLQFLLHQLQGLTATPVVAVCFIAGFILCPVLTDT